MNAESARPDVLRLTCRLDEAPIGPLSWPTGARLTGYEPGDAAAVSSFLVVAYRGGGGDPSFYADWARFVPFDDEFDPVLLFLARDEAGAIIGLCHVWTSAFVKDLAVASTWRRRGLGRALLITACEAGRRRGWTTLDLKVQADNLSALPLYDAFGFRPVARPD